MKTMRLTLIAALLATAMLVGCTNANASTSGTTFNGVQSQEDQRLTLSLEGYGSIGALEDSSLTLVDMLTYAMQDEYLAHREYSEIIAKYGDISPYNNIRRSEETHIDYLTDLFKSYDLDMPEDDSADYIIEPGSLLEAAEIGVQAEINNIAMYDLFLEQSVPQDVADVFMALRDASESHLSAFEKQVGKLS